MSDDHHVKCFGLLIRALDNDVRNHAKLFAATVVRAMSAKKDDPLRMAVV